MYNFGRFLNDIENDIYQKNQKGIKKMNKWVDPIPPSLQICKDHLKEKKNEFWLKKFDQSLNCLPHDTIFTALLVTSIGDTTNYITNF